MDTNSWLPFFHRTNKNCESVSLYCGSECGFHSDAVMWRSGFFMYLKSRTWAGSFVSLYVVFILPQCYQYTGTSQIGSESGSMSFKWRSGSDKIMRIQAYPDIGSIELTYFLTFCVPFRIATSLWRHGEIILLAISQSVGAITGINLTRILASSWEINFSVSFLERFRKDVQCWYKSQRQMYRSVCFCLLPFDIW